MPGFYTRFPPTLSSEWPLKVKEEVMKQLSMGFIRVIDYHSWLTKIVLVRKANGKVWICVDYRDLNWACPKDDFPLPNFNLILDNTANHALKSFIDGFAYYNQIKMHPDHKEVEVYVDDMIIKSKEREGHIPALRAFFEKLQQYTIRLNPHKCVFGVTKWMLLGYIVSEKGIEVNPAKVKGIRKIPETRIEKEVRGFVGNLHYISRFISKFTQTCEPIFKLLMKSSSREWNDQRQEAFNKIKSYLFNPSVLAPTQTGNPTIVVLNHHGSSYRGHACPTSSRHSERASHLLR